MKRPIILITDGKDTEAEIMKVPELLKDVGEIRYAPKECRYSDDALSENVKGVEALIVAYSPITKRVIDKANTLKVVARLGAGYDNVDVKAATEKGIFVVYAPRTSVEGMAEYIIGMMIALSRRFFWADRMVRKGKWSEAGIKMFGKDSQILGKTLGIIGFGAVGSRLAERAKAFNMRIVSYDPYVSQEYMEEHGVEKVNLDTLISMADFISLNTALTEETRHLINEERLRKMKKTAFIINTSRGGVIDEKALYKALKEEWIAGAALDVTDPEPPKDDNPLFTLDNVIFTPHIAGANKERVEAIGKSIAEDVKRILTGKLPRLDHLVNVDVLTKLK